MAAARMGWYSPADVRRLRGTYLSHRGWDSYDGILDAYQSGCGLGTDDHPRVADFHAVSFARSDSSRASIASSVTCTCAAPRSAARVVFTHDAGEGPRSGAGSTVSCPRTARCAGKLTYRRRT